MRVDQTAFTRSRIAPTVASVKRPMMPMMGAMKARSAPAGPPSVRGPSRFLVVYRRYSGARLQKAVGGGSNAPGSIEGDVIGNGKRNTG